MEPVFTLDRLGIGHSARVAALAIEGAMRARLCDLGFTPGSEVVCLFDSAFRDPRAYRVRETVVALRQSDAAGILCSACGGKG